MPPSDPQGARAQNLLAALEHVVACLGDAELPVRVEAALSLRAFLRAEQLTEQIKPVRRAPPH